MATRCTGRAAGCSTLPADLTVTVLRRTPQNLVDILTADGRYLRAITGTISPLVLQVMQPSLGGPLEATLYMSGSGTVAYDEDRARQMFADVARTLGTRVDLEGFYEMASRERELAVIVREARGVKPPRYSSLWEAICNAVVYQQVSLEAATSTMRKFSRISATLYRLLITPFTPSLRPPQSSKLILTSCARSDSVPTKYERCRGPQPPCLPGSYAPKSWRSCRRLKPCRV